jgi:tetratricopeptide (TPR) repeat protein
VEVCRRALALRPRFAEGLNLMGSAFAAMGRREEALQALRQAVAVKPKLAEAQANLGLALRQAGETEGAIRHLRKAVKLKPSLGEAHVHLGNLYVTQGARRDAVRHFQAALNQDPKNAGCHVNLGNVFQEDGETEKAEGHYRKALDLEPGLPAAHGGLAALLQAQGRLAESIEHARAALKTAPSAGGFAKLASVLERAHRLEEAGEAAGAALALEPGHPDARLVLAKLHARRGEPAAAIEAYEALVADLEDTASDTRRTLAARAQADLAALLEKAGDYGRAFALFEAANRLNRESEPEWTGQAAAYIGRVAKVAGMIEGLAGQDWRPAVPEVANLAPAPVFMVGFPRSGTTLLDQVLNAHSRVTVLEERTLIDRIIGEFGQPEKSLLPMVMGLDDRARARLRRRYWELLARETGRAGEVPGAEAPLLVDKLPLNTINLWLIHGIFPEAKIILSLRDPRDVALSCFTNLFKMGEGLAAFPTLENAAELYAAVMGLWLRYRSLLPLDHHVLRYEDLVGDLAGEARRLTAFLGLDWEDAVLNYREAAGQRYIVTPSYHQVVRPLYGSSIGRWRYYRDQMAAVEARLAAFVGEFGYGDAEA